MVTVVKNSFPEGDDRGTNGNLIATNYAAWLEAIRLSKNLFNSGKLISAEFEDPDIPLIWHGCIFEISGNIDLNERETGELGDFLKCFDGLTIISEGDTISFSGIKHIYQP